MPPFAILWPTFALVALILVVWVTLVVKRIGHMRATPPGADDFASGDAALRYFRPVELPANNLANLFELPVLYFALVPLLLLTTAVTPAQVALAWIYVATRAAHSFVHIFVRKVPLRFFAYLASVVALSAMWVGFAVDTARAETEYNRAMDALEAGL